MGRKKKVAEVKAPEPKVFEWGDLIVKCKCGREQMLHKGVQHGLQLILQTREDSFIQLMCDSCGADVRLMFLEGEAPPQPVEVPTEESKEKTDESVQQENKEEQSL